MSVQEQRVPLSQYSNVKLNRMPLLSSGHNTVRRLNSNGVVPQLINSIDENLQPIDLNTKLKANSTSLTVNYSSTKNTNKNVLLNESPVDKILKTTIPKESIHNATTTTSARNINVDTVATKPTKNINNLYMSNNEKIDYTELSKKLQIRLQFAYYKLRTKQIHKSFSDLKNCVVNSDSETVASSSKHSTSSNNTNKIIKRSSQIKTKRRKLVVSHGNYKTPAKKHPNIIIDAVTSNDTMISTPSTMINNTTSNSISVDSNKTGILLPHRINATAVTTTTTTKLVEKNKDDIDTNTNKPIDTNTLSPNNNTTLLDCHTTPIRDPLKQLPKTHVEQVLSNTNSISIQETPMRVKAAKSLIQLFSSTTK